MDNRSLDPLFSRIRSAPPTVSDDDIRSLIARGTTTDRRRTPLFLYLNPISLSGVIMTALLAIIIGVVFLDSPDRPSSTRNAAVVSHERETSDATDATRYGTELSKILPHLPRITIKERHAEDGATTVQSNPDGASARGTSTSARTDDRSSLPVIGDQSMLMLGSPLYPIIDTERFASSDRMGWVSDALLPLVAHPPLFSALPEPDSTERGRDSVWNYAGVYWNNFYTTCSFSSMNAHLAAAGFASIGADGGFGQGLSIEFPRPGADSAFPFTFPIFLYPAKNFYSPGISVEWLLKPEASSTDGSRKASYSSWNFLLDNTWYVKTYRQGRMLFVASVGVNVASLSLADARSFDEILKTGNAGSTSMSRASMLLRTALRYDHVFVGIQFGLSAGYTFSLAKGNWRIRSGFEVNPGIGTSGGPDDSIGGWHVGFSFTLRGTESTMKTK